MEHFMEIQNEKEVTMWRGRDALSHDGADEEVIQYHQDKRI